MQRLILSFLDGGYIATRLMLLLNFSVLWNMNVLFVDTDSGSQTGTCLSDIKFEYRKIKLSEHIDVCGHGQFQVFPFYKLLSDNVIERREK